ncbi:DUF397 domain-containing protein [Micromonospora sp. NPDC049559]|uniref:DUF397 domain-containing protein n=1 Tax=Micromonospora sp. NPDC049559 TaxID=3155923 RepID=UPI00341E8EEF
MEAPVGEFVKTARSNDQGMCVQVARTADGGVTLRDSKNPTGPVLTFTGPEWDAHVNGVKDGEFDLN